VELDTNFYLPRKRFHTLYTFGTLVSSFLFGRS
jgi:hypothetical protein